MSLITAYSLTGRLTTDSQHTTSSVDIINNPINMCSPLAGRLRRHLTSFLPHFGKDWFVASWLRTLQEYVAVFIAVRHACERHAPNIALPTPATHFPRRLLSMAPCIHCPLGAPATHLGH